MTRISEGLPTGNAGMMSRLARVNGTLGQILIKQVHHPFVERIHAYTHIRSRSSFNPLVTLIIILVEWCKVKRGDLMASVRIRRWVACGSEK